MTIRNILFSDGYEPYLDDECADTQNTEDVVTTSDDFEAVSKESLFTELQAAVNGLYSLDGNGKYSDIDIEAVARYVENNLPMKNIIFKGNDGNSLRTLYLYDEKKGLYVPGTDRIKSAVQNLFESHRDKAPKGPVLSILEDSDKFEMNSDHILNNKPDNSWILLKNGRLNLETGEFLEGYDAQMVFTAGRPVVYDPEAKCPMFDAFLEWALTPDVSHLDGNPEKNKQDARSLAQRYIDGMWEMFGYTFMNGQPLQKGFLMYGPGDNGKGVIITALTAMNGEENSSSVRLDDIDGSRFATANLFGKTLNVSTELSGRMLKGTNMLKQLMSNDDINAEFKCQQAFKFKNNAKMVFAGNYISESPDTTPGFYRRWIIFKLLNTVPEKEKDPYLAEKIVQSELSGIFNRALDGYRRLKAQGRFTNDMSTDLIEEEYSGLSNTVATFVAERCETMNPETEVDTNGNVRNVNQLYVKADVLEGAYRDYCKKTRKAAISHKQLARKIKEADSIIEHKKKKLDGKSVWCYLNIRLLESYELEAKGLDKFQTP